MKLLNLYLIFGKHVVFQDTFFLHGYYYKEARKAEYLMKMKNFHVDFSDSILCDTCPEETIAHLFFVCSFSQSFWWTSGYEWNSDLDIHSMIKDARERYSTTFMMQVLITGCWSL
jgi:hypothetical protein